MKFVVKAENDRFTEAARRMKRGITIDSPYELDLLEALLGAGLVSLPWL